ncbi:MAG: hypothetical protein ACK2T3_07045, partial [Candidatus Promineifilaceae bacterium]
MCQGFTNHPEVGAQATRISTSDEPVVPHLVASPAIIPLYPFGLDGDKRLAIPSTNLCSSLPRP